MHSTQFFYREYYNSSVLLVSKTPVSFFPLSCSTLDMLLPHFHLIPLISLPWSLASPLSLPTAIRRTPGFHLPLTRVTRREINTSTPRRLPKESAIGLGDYFDVCVFKRTTAASSLIAESEHTMCKFKWARHLRRLSSVGFHFIANYAA